MPPEAPRVKVPVFKKDTALVMVPVAPLSWRLYPAVAVFKVVAVSAPLKAIVPVVAVKVVVVSLTVLVKVVPPEFVMVRVSSGTPPIAPVTLIVPLVPEFRVSD